MVRISGTPIMLAASSSSRIASQARPSRPVRMRSETKTQNAARTAEDDEAVRERRTGPSELCTPGSAWKGPVPMASTGKMPWVPLVRL